MQQWGVLYRKELTEMVRNYKILWIPLVFILLGVMQPISSYYMPEILDNFGGLPEGAIIEMPLPTGAEVLISVLSNYGMLGVLILVLSAMGIVSAERRSGVAGMVMSKPVAYSSYILSKWAGVVTITLLSFLIGYLASWYYTNLLFESVATVDILKSFAIYSLWLILVVTLTLFFSTIMKENGSAAFITILVIVVASTVTSLLKNKLEWSPSNLTGHTGHLLQTGELQSSFLPVLLITIALIILILVLTIQIFKRKEILE